MIRINLLNDINLINEDFSQEESSSKLKKMLFIGVPTIIVIGLIGHFSLTLFPAEKVIPEIAVQKRGPVPQKPEYRPKVVISNSVEEIVKEIEGENRRKSRISTYKDLVPAAKIEFQLLICKKALAHIKSVTTSEIGFIDLIVTTPGDIYIHGMASSKDNYKIFKQKLVKPTFLSAKSGIVKLLEENEETIEFSIYGHFKFKPPATRKNRSINKSQLKNNVSKFKEIIKGSDLSINSFKLKSISNVGAYKRYIYKLSLKNCSFSKFQNFINKLQISQANTGILKFALKAAGGEEMTANLDMILYLK